MKLGKLQKIELRSYWKHEASDFTKWLSQNDNLELLGDELGLDIKLVQTEAGVGRYSADILAKEENTGNLIVIENQLEITNHNHLGQILTYAAGVEAEYIVWIAKDVREEHRQAIDWLNEHTSERLNFFLLVIELWQIGNSDPAPKFSVISRPNDWTKSVRGKASDPSNLTDTKITQLEFWRELKEYASTKQLTFKLRTPRAQHWYDISIGRSDCHVALTMLATESKIGCQLYIPDSKDLFKIFLVHKDAIENDIGLGELSWQELPEKKASRIIITKQFDMKLEQRKLAFDWLLECVGKFKGAFSKSWD